MGSEAETIDLDRLERSARYWDRQVRKAEKTGDRSRLRVSRRRRSQLWGQWIEALVTQRGQ